MYYDLLEKNMNQGIQKLNKLGEEVKAQMKECKLLYSPKGQQIKINEIYNKAFEKAKELKEQEIVRLKQILDIEKTKLNTKNEPTDINEKILAELQKLNNSNSFNNKLNSMSVDEIFAYEKENFLSQQEVDIMKSVLTNKIADSKEKGEILTRVRSIKYISKNELLDQAYQRLQLFEKNNEMFPGMSIADSLTGGISKILGNDIVSEINEVNYFGDNTSNTNIGGNN